MGTWVLLIALRVFDSAWSSSMFTPPSCWTKYSLNPTAPALTISDASLVCVGKAELKATLTCIRCSAVLIRCLRVSVLIVMGLLLGMSMTVVMPPAAAAFVPVSKVSRYANCSSLRCTWVSMSPGRAICPCRFSFVEAVGRFVSFAILVIFPLSTAMPALTRPLGVYTLAL